MGSLVIAVRRPWRYDIHYQFLEDIRFKTEQFNWFLNRIVHSGRIGGISGLSHGGRSSSRSGHGQKKVKVTERLLIVMHK